MYESEVLPRDVRDGDILYVCDYRFIDMNNKPIRKVFPTKVIIRCNSKTKKRIYYSNYHCVGLSKDDKLLKSKVYPIYDNTGNRSNTGTPLRMFKSLDDCLICFSEMCIKIETDTSNWLREKRMLCKGRYAEMKGYIIKTS